MRLLHEYCACHASKSNISVSSAVLYYVSRLPFVTPQNFAIPIILTVLFHVVSPESYLNDSCLPIYYLNNNVKITIYKTIILIWILSFGITPRSPLEVIFFSEMVRAETTRKNRRGWEDNNKMDHEETGSGYVPMAGTYEAYRLRRERRIS